MLYLRKFVENIKYFTLLVFIILGVYKVFVTYGRNLKWNLSVNTLLRVKTTGTISSCTLHYLLKIKNSQALL